VVAESNGNRNGADPAAIRPALARLAAQNLDELQRALLDAALSATTVRWATVTCSGCSAKSHVELPVPDVKARLQAIQLLLSESLGRAPAAPEAVAAAVPTISAAAAKMGWREAQFVFATAYSTEIAEVARVGGPQALQERLARLSDGERRVLAEALEAVG
jgi:hypothetical protein